MLTTFSRYILRRFPVAAALTVLAGSVPFCVAQAPATTQPASGQSLPESPVPQSPVAQVSSSQQVQVVTPEQEAAARRARGDAQIKSEEKQRILGVVPNFNVIDMDEAVPLSPRQKFQLMFKSSVDPAIFLIAALNGAVGQAEDDFEGYGQGWGPYGQRFGASYADTVDGNFWGNAVFPILLHEDPRYFRLGKGSIKRRILYSVSTTFRTKNDSGEWVPNYGNVAGNLVSGGISNLYYPASDRGIGLTFQNAATVTAEGALGAVFYEFWPDIHKRLFKKSETTPKPIDLPR